MDNQIVSIHRFGNHIRIMPSVTAIEGRDGNLPSLIIRKHRRVIARYRGSSLAFSAVLTDEDKRYLMSLATI